jgi:hypothetical protein
VVEDLLSKHEAQSSNPSTASPPRQNVKSILKKHKGRVRGSEKGAAVLSRGNQGRLHEESGAWVGL